MVEFLSEFDRFTKLVCTDEDATIPKVIPIFNDVFSFLEAVISSPATSHLIKLAARMALHILKKYYAKTDETPIFVVSVCECALLSFWYFAKNRISFLLAAVCDPRVRFHLFETEDWAHYKDEIRTTIYTIFNRDYRVPTGQPTALASAIPQEQLPSISHKKWAYTRTHDSIFKSRRVEVEDELLVYWNGRQADKNWDPLEWWQVSGEVVVV